ncbi:hypothetical protein QRK82_23425, partial [Mycobacteroides abscessus]|nr:hypothetical protein [Mycobacteroides abscessus]MDM3919061.1 hypothetical protein [Mycobacteroides abscessus]
ASDPDDVVAELAGVGPCHGDILPARPCWASQLRCHLFVQQTHVVQPPGTGTVAELTVTNAITGAAGASWVEADDHQVLRDLAAPICRTAKSTAC